MASATANLKLSTQCFKVETRRYLQNTMAKILSQVMTLSMWFCELGNINIEELV